ncbi:hypothetical protein LCGC14_1444390 [marine sediment metagenome]|uniref:Uncharacterized protein n=1 Tax=marine sediment metagenome TaxID=412755 RepID=A0A0F9M072_9ZZZZ
MDIREGIALEIGRDSLKGGSGTVRISKYLPLAEKIVQYLKSEGIVRKGQSLGATHPHLATYYTVEEL